MAVSSIAGGFLAAHCARRLRSSMVCWLIISGGLGLADYYCHKQMA
ncbi:MAG TPA: hypothetical protein VH592_19840 [Gemmataceae bacterium]